MFQDSRLNNQFFGSFFEEAAKLASIPHVPHVPHVPHAPGGTAAPVKNLFRKRDAAMLALGAGAAYGGKRIVDDVRSGEQVRKQQHGGY